MTYFGFLLAFVVLPILALVALTYRDRRQGRMLPASFWLSPRLGLAVMVVIAVTYTTPWDNYLVATGVWWYDPALVTGITLGWVPLEEYTFFVLQPVLTGLWLLFLARRVNTDSPFIPRKSIRAGSAAVVGLVWVVSIILLFSGWRPGNYLSLELGWALPPIALQLGFGADILWRYRNLVVTAILTSTLYLGSMDALAIHSGTWTINPERSLGVLMGGILPVEEAVFFLLTNVLLVFGLTLALAKESIYRLPLRTIRLLAPQNQQASP